MNKVLVTGVNGFVGEHVARAFHDADFRVIGTARQAAPHPKVAELLTDYHMADLSDKDSLRKLDMRSVQAVVHLAGLADVGRSFEQPLRYIQQNPTITYNLHQQLHDSGFAGRIINVSTGALYDSAQPLPLTEGSRTHPSSPYAISKLASEEVSHYWSSRGIDTVVARPFNHIGPGQSRGFLIPDLYHQLASTETVRVGNIETKRDYTDVRDIALAYRALALADTLGHDTYNVCSGQSISGANILNLLIRLGSYENAQVTIDPTKLRPNDIPNIYGDASRLSNELGWHPTHTIEQTVADIIASEQ